VDFVELFWILKNENEILELRFFLPKVHVRIGWMKFKFNHLLVKFALVLQIHPTDGFSWLFSMDVRVGIFYTCFFKLILITG
jgi:hypothetical protein